MTGVVQRGFSGGIVDGALVARSDVPKRIRGMEVCRNSITGRTGSVYNRMGTAFDFEAKDGHDNIQLRAWDTGDEAYLLEFGTGYVRVHQLNSDGGIEPLTVSAAAWSGATAYTPGQCASAGGSNYICVAGNANKDPTSFSPDYTKQFWYELTDDILELPTPIEEGELPDVSVAMSTDDSSDDIGVMTVATGAHMLCELRHQGDDTWVFEAVNIGPSATAPGLTQVLTGSAGSPPSVPNWTFEYTVTSVQKNTGVESAMGYDAGALQTGAAASYLSSTTQDIEIDLGSAHGLENNAIVHIVSVDTVSADESNLNAVKALQGKTFVVTKHASDPNIFYLNGTAGIVEKPWLAGLMPDVTVDYAPAYTSFLNRARPNDSDSSRRLSFTWDAIDGVEEYRVYRRAEVGADATPTGVFELVGIVKGTEFIDRGLEEDATANAPDHINPFVSGNWPSKVAYFQQRTVLSGCAATPSTVYFGVTGDYRSFGKHSTVEDTDGFSFKVVSGDGSEVHAIVTIGELLVLTSGVIWVVQGNNDGAVTPTATLLPLSYEGAGRIDPLKMGSAVVFPEVIGTQVLEVRYNGPGAGFMAYGEEGPTRDVTAYAANIFDGGPTIASWAWSRTPNSTVWAARSDGQVVAMTYIRDQGYVAWHQHDTYDCPNGVTTQAHFLQVSTLRGPDANIPVFLVRRQVNGSNKYYIEHLPTRTVGNPNTDDRQTCRFVDSHVTQDGTYAGVETLTISGVSDWGEGTEASVVSSEASYFAPGDVGSKALRLKHVDSSLNEYEVEAEITGYTDGETVTVTFLGDYSAVKTAIAGSGFQTSDWTVMLDEVTGLSHLDNHDVMILADGRVEGPRSVTSGSVSLDSYAGVAHVGLRIVSEGGLFDIDVQSELDGIFSKPKIVKGATAVMRNTRGLTFGSSRDGLKSPYDKLPGDETLSKDSIGLVSGKRAVNVVGDWGPEGKVYWRQDQPLPYELLAIVRNATIKQGYS